MAYLPFIALALLALSGLLIDAHRRTWNAVAEDSELDERDRRAARAQYLRRLRASGTIGVLGALLILRPLVPAEPLWFTLYLLLLVLLCAWMLMLALVDGFANALRVRRARQQTESLEAKLERELRAARDRLDD
ncbi:hypothetical protein NG895_01650 [Aeoliella sp. ICT_H6.2]|uniref:Uncharacterized protein n=1 Tax=Aeoliella straminimaris TaxID=2954799 RepID=A0A9X2FEH3_9BACT|nr:hypothetical protein [Aeoliella straminimaris]MCO6042601.1 hypothetical protein [Aeoliella straminimaris]